jgi:hypothetical protein
VSAVALERDVPAALKRYPMNSKFLRISAWLAIAFGVFLVFGETRRNWNDWGHWPSYTFDYLFAALLVIFGYLSLQGRGFARILLVATWVLTITLFTYSFTGHIQHLDEPTNGPIPHLELTIWIGALDVVAICGLVYALLSFKATQSRSTHGAA